MQATELAFGFDEYQALQHLTREYLWFYRLAEWLAPDNKRHVVILDTRLAQIEEDLSRFLVGTVPYGQ